MRLRQRFVRALVVAAAFETVAMCVAVAQRSTEYVPPPSPAWEHRTPEQVGMDGAKLHEAIAFAKEHEVKASRDLEAVHYQTFGREPFGSAVGPIKPRGEMSGVIVRRGYIVAEWGDPARVDMTFSVTKSFVSTTVGLAVEHGLIRSIDDTVFRYMAPVAARRDTGVAHGRRRRPVRHAHDHRTLRHAAQPNDHLAASAAADERLGRHALGKTGMGRSAHRRARDMVDAGARRAGIDLRVQRHARERARARGAQRVAPPAPAAVA